MRGAGASGTTTCGTLPRSFDPARRAWRCALASCPRRELGILKHQHVVAYLGSFKARPARSVPGRDHLATRILLLAALALSVAAMCDQTLPAEARARIAHDTARIAIRLRAEHELAEAVALTTLSEKPASPTFDAWRAWEQGLVDGADGATVEHAARELEGLGLLALAVESWSDAAILAARAGRSSEALDTATTLAESIGMHPLLGPLPETRWLEESDAEQAAERVT